MRSGAVTLASPASKGAAAASASGSFARGLVATTRGIVAWQSARSIGRSEPSKCFRSITITSSHRPRRFRSRTR